MLKHYVLVFFCFGCFTILAQDNQQYYQLKERWYLGVQATRGFANDLGYHVHQPENELGIFTGYRLSRKLALQSGLTFGKSGAFIYRTYTSGNLTDFKYESVNIYQVPLLLRVDLTDTGNRLTPYILLGINFNIIDGRSFLTPLGGDEPSDNRIFYSPALNAGARYRINNRFDLHLELKYSGQGLATNFGIGYRF